MIRINNIKISPKDSQEKLIDEICKILKINKNLVVNYEIHKKSIDARKKNDIKIVYTVDVEVKDENKIKLSNRVIRPKKVNYEQLYLDKEITERPIIIGSGPAGLFCGLILAIAGAKPIIIEQGKNVYERKKDILEFWESGILKSYSNVQFGAGGAGTFSDGKINSGIKNVRCKKVIEEMILAGAPEDISYDSKPHIGTDYLIKVVDNIIKKIISHGGEIRYSTRFIDFKTENDNIKSINVIKDDKITNIDCKILVLAIGHSSRDTFNMLYKKGINMQSKNFSVGVRIEHNRSWVDKMQYGKYSKYLKSADYKLSTHLPNGRGVYTFCMCPGGKVVNSSSEEGGLVTNGMSYYDRDEMNSNSAVLVSITDKDYISDSPLAGINLQRNLEKKAFIAGGSNYYAPSQKLSDFINKKKTTEFGKVIPSFKPGVTMCNLWDVLDEYICNSLLDGIINMDRKIPGFADDDAVLTAVESRSSSPVRIIRKDNYSSNINGIYPCGEGAGYAGGIMSSAVDGITCAEKIIKQLMNA